MRGWTAAACLLGAALLVPGCGTETAPTAGDGEAGLAAPVSTLSLSGDFLPAAAGKKGKKDRKEKDAAAQPRGPWSDREKLDREGGKVKIKDEGREKDVDGEALREGIEVELKVPKKGLDDDAEIAMEVTGYHLSELAIVFGPAGLEFLEDAEIKIKVGSDRVDLDPNSIFGIHVDATGRTDLDVEVKVKKDGDVEIRIRIPGFSRYSLGE